MIDAARTIAGFAVEPAVFTTTVETLNAARVYPLDASQVELARRFASDDRLLEVGIGPAGTGKTTAMRAFARAVEAGGGRVLALAPTVAASTVLAEEIKVEAETAHTLVDVHRNGSKEQQELDQYRIDGGTVLLIDEAGMVSTPLLADVLELAQRHGATIRLLGDPAPLAAVESGGALRLIEQRVGASVEHDAIPVASGSGCCRSGSRADGRAPPLRSQRSRATRSAHARTTATSTA